MPQKYDHLSSAKHFRKELEEHNHDLGELPGWMFEDLVLYFDSPSSMQNGATTQNGIIPPAELRMKQASNTARIAGARVTDDMKEAGITHVVVGEDRSNLRSIRRDISR